MRAEQLCAEAGGIWLLIVHVAEDEIELLIIFIIIVLLIEADADLDNFCLK
jgi:hypothetical protein